MFDPIVTALLRTRDLFVALVVKAINKLSDEPMLALAAAQAAYTTADDQSTKGYIIAVVFALARFAVSPALPRIPE